MSVAAGPDDAGMWIGLQEAKRILMVGQRAIENLVASGRLTCRHVPGSRAKVLRNEVEALVERSTRTPTKALLERSHP